MKHILKIPIVLLALILFLPACTDDFAELNTNPNEPTLVPPDVIFPFAMRRTVDRLHGHRTRLQRINLDGGMLWVQYLARNQYTNEGDTYDPDASMRNNNWEGFYVDGLINFQKVIDLSSDPESEYYNENMAAIGLISREFLYAMVTDIWGAIPYSESLQGAAGNLAPYYSSQEEVYTGVLENLRLATEMLDEAGPAIKGDILFNGDISRWKKFASSVRLKLANRQAAMSPGTSSQVFSEIMSNPTSFPVFESNDDYAVLHHEARLGENNNNAWHEVMVNDAREDWSISRTLINHMTDGQGNPTDPRITVYAEPALAGDMAGLYVGAENGLPEALASVYINTASRPGHAFLQETGPANLMTYSELLFVLAEAAMTGTYTGGLSAKEYLDMAVQASFDQYDLEMPEGYLDDLTPDLETIITEKWKALFGQGIEAWTEYRRTGYPILSDPSPEAIFANDGKVPTRLKYPESEYSLNRANVEAGTSMNGGPDDKLTSVWWAN